jgi:esterase FrsA
MVDEEKSNNEMVTLRTWEELSNEVQNRADLQRYPLTGMQPEDVREALKNTGSLNRDSWSKSWSRIGDRYRTLAEKQLEHDVKQASENYLNAWRFFGFAAWPTQNTSLKKQAFKTSLESFRSYAGLVSPSIERLQIPFQKQKVTFYLQIPE